MDDDLSKLLALVSELSLQLAVNRDEASRLGNKVQGIKNQAVHHGTGFSLRRFNTDLSQETFESELEKENAQLRLENQALQGENRELTHLLREHASTLETVMSKFRAEAHASQLHHLALCRYYESILAERESQKGDGVLAITTSYHESLARISTLVRKALRSTSTDHTGSPKAGDYNGPPHLKGFALNGWDHPLPRSALGGTGGEPEDRYKDSWTLLGGSSIQDDALEDDVEFARLKFENEQLRSILQDPEQLEHLFPLRRSRPMTTSTNDWEVGGTDDSDSAGGRASQHRGSLFKVRGIPPPPRRSSQQSSQIFSADADLDRAGRPMASSSSGGKKNLASSGTRRNSTKRRGALDIDSDSDSSDDDDDDDDDDEHEPSTSLHKARYERNAGRGARTNDEVQETVSGSALGAGFWAEDHPSKPNLSKPSQDEVKRSAASSNPLDSPQLDGSNTFPPPAKASDPEKAATIYVKKTEEEEREEEEEDRRQMRLSLDYQGFIDVGNV